MRALLLKKFLRGLRTRKGQFSFMTLAVFLAVFAVATMLGAYTVLKREMRNNYMSTAPAQATIVLDRIDSGLRGWMEDSRSVETWEARGSVMGRVKTASGGWLPLLVFVVDDFTRVRVGKMFPVNGAEPAPGSLLMERSGTDLLGGSLPEGGAASLTVVFPGTGEKDIPLSGLVHDPGLAPSWQERTIYAYTDAATASVLTGQQAAPDQLKVIFAGAGERGAAAGTGAGEAAGAAARGAPTAAGAGGRATPTTAEITSRAVALAGEISAMGYTVREIQVPPPERHPHQSQMNTVILVFLVFSGLSLILSSILLASVMRTLLGTETRLIGIMKSVGGRPWRIARHYLMMAAAPAVFGSLAALPAGALAAGGLSAVVSSLLNLQPASTAVPGWALLAALGVGVLLPVLTAGIPVAAALRMSVVKALNPMDLGRPPRKESRAALPALPAMSLRNLGRRPARLVLSLALLGAAGCLFMTSMNLQAGWSGTLTRSLSLRRFDLEMRLTGPVDAEAARRALLGVPGVRTAESRPILQVFASSAGGFPVSSVYPDRGHGSFSLRGLPVGSTLVELPLIAGTALDDTADAVGRAPGAAAPAPGAAAGDAPAILLNQNALALIPGKRPGDEVVLIISGASRPFRLAGVVREFAPASAYVREADMAPLLKGSNAFIVAYDPAYPGARTEISRACEQAVRSVGGTVAMGLPEDEYSTAIGEHAEVLISALLLMSILMGLTGLLGLSASLGASVLERTRETGVLRGIGAGGRAIASIIILEAELTAVFSMGISVILSFPLSWALGKVFGQLAFRLPLDFIVSGPGLVYWIALSLIGAGLSCAGIAARTLRRPLPEALAWE